MKYAIFGDLHSNIEDTKAVLRHISQVEPNALKVCLGDLYECTISSKIATNVSNLTLDECAIVTDEFEELLTFPSIRGNQEERIRKVSGINRFFELPDKIIIDDATLIHGHQIEWGYNGVINNLLIKINTPIVFFGHIHRSRIFKNDDKDEKVQLDFNFGEEFKLNNERYWINVGPVCIDRVWCLYDSIKKTITFMNPSTLAKAL